VPPLQLKDYYKTLGVKPSAAMPDIKKAYRTLAVKYHPDKNPDNVWSEAQFKEVNEAYSVLGNSTKRAKYDDDRWLAGMGSKTSYNDAVTPQWLKNVCIELNNSLAKMDTYRMSQRTLQAYILLILEDAHLGILIQEDDTKTNNAIINELLKATAKLELKYLDAILKPLRVIAGNNADAHQQIETYAASRLRDEQRSRMFPYVVLLVTLALCVFMYIYGNMQ
jgi:molecular chaperone DnaJ